jgi:excisionase family DNA binding protein
VPSTKTKRKRDPRSTEPKRPFAERNGKYLSLQEVADYLGVTRNQAVRLIAGGHGDLKSVLVGRIRRVHVDDLTDYERRIRGEGQ